MRVNVILIFVIIIKMSTKPQLKPLVYYKIAN